MKIIISLEYSTPKEISMIFHNVLNSDYHLIIKGLGKVFEGKLNCSLKIIKSF